ncbi:MAG: hypothetical protein ACK5HP_03090 [Bacilli bacterium]
MKKLKIFADWQSWGYTIAETLEYGLGQEFLDNIDKNKTRQDEQIIAQNLLIQIILQFMNWKTIWKGKMQDFYKELIFLQNDYSTNISKSSASLSRSIGEQLSVFKSQGLIIERKVGTGNYRYIKITYNIN